MLENILSPLIMDARTIHFPYIPLIWPFLLFRYDATSFSDSLLTILEASLCALHTDLKQFRRPVSRYTAADIPSRHFRANIRRAAFLHPLAAAFSGGRLRYVNANVRERLFSSIRILFLKLRYSLNGEVAGNVPPPT